jgi:hypothetical protein
MYPELQLNTAEKASQKKLTQIAKFTVVGVSHYATNETKGKGDNNRGDIAGLRRVLAQRLELSLITQGFLVADRLG